MPSINLTTKKRQPVQTYSKKQAQAIYNTPRWKKLRVEKLRCNPICEHCEEADRTTPASEVHHIIPFMSVTNHNHRLKLAFDFDNLQSLCHDCHDLMHNHKKQITETGQKLS